MAPDDSGARGGLVTKSRLFLPARENSERRDEGVTARGGVVIPPSGLEPPGSLMEAQSPIPNPLPNDDEDVSWALSTAGALWGRGERAEALKWLRRAAEQASDVNDDQRSLALFKAAADVSSLVSTSTPPPPTASVPPPSTSVTPPPVASGAPPSTVAAPPPVASAAPAGSFPAPPSRASAPPPPPRKGPPSLPPRNSRPPLPPSRSQAPPPPASTRPVPPQQPASAQAAPPQAAAPQAAAPPPAAPQPAAPQPATPQPPAATRAAPPRARQGQGNDALSPVTKVSRVPSPVATPQISPVARSIPGRALADAAVPGRRPEPAPQRAVTPVRTSVLGPTVPTRPVAFSPSPVTTPVPGVATERLPPSRRAGVFDEIVNLQQAPGGGGAFDDLDENTEVLNAVRRAPTARKSTAQEIEEGFQAYVGEPRGPGDADFNDEVTDPGVHGRALDSAGDEQTGPVSVPERTVVFTAAERAALVSAPDLRASESTGRKFAPLLAHRVAVVASSTPGELRVVLLDPSGPPPVGAAIAMLVPISTADGDEIAQLVGSLE